MQRLGKNIGGYFGESIDIHRVLQEVEKAVAERNWICDRDGNFVAYRRMPAGATKRVYISTGIHGDEPAGPLAMLQLLQEDQWPGELGLWICPCLNLPGFALQRRENAEGVDLNRDYRHLQSEEVRRHVRWLQPQPDFDAALCLHEDWEAQGFYVYELNPDGRPSLAEKIVEAVAKVCPIDQSPMIETWPAENGMIRPKVKPEERPQWPESLYLITTKTRQSCTLEAPSDFPLATRVAALVVGVRAALEAARAG